ncbi:MAG: glycosyltransferase family 4 protein [Flavobacteriaceae bacterium]|nr:glycosyltransferase family 4 protein [Flavobacteriaceae bacterium]
MKKERLLLILHYSPPVHGASIIGDTILNSDFLRFEFDTKFIKIESSKKLSDIRKFSIKKIFYFIKLFFRILSSIIVFRPQVIYFTASPNGKAFYRDLILSLPIKFFNLFIKYRVFYHYHSKGVNNFTTSSIISKKLTSFFVNKVHLIFISKCMKKEVAVVNNYKKLHILNNGVEQKVTLKDFEKRLRNKNKIQTTNVLFLSNMMLDKGYDIALKLAKEISQHEKNNVKFHFAGEWFSEKDKEFFYEYININKLNEIVSYHGFVEGQTKKELFQKANIFLFPSKKEVFPLTVLEALSYGLPVLAFDVGAVSEIVTKEVGIISSKDEILNSFIEIQNQYLNKDVSLACRNRFLENYTTAIFERNLVAILKLNHERRDK